MFVDGAKYCDAEGRGKKNSKYEACIKGITMMYGEHKEKMEERIIKCIKKHSKILTQGLIFLDNKTKKNWSRLDGIIIFWTFFMFSY